VIAASDWPVQFAEGKQIDLISWSVWRNVAGYTSFLILPLPIDPSFFLLHLLIPVAGFRYQAISLYLMT